MVDTRIQWLRELERLSPWMKTYNLSASFKECVYVDRPSGQPPRFHDEDAYSIANDSAHNAIVVDAIAALQGRLAVSSVSSLVGELTFRKTYGAFSELVAYKWLGDAKVDFTAQVPMTKAEVLNPNGSTIDGQMMLAGAKTACFDVKGFGFVAHKIKLLQKRLEEKFSGKSVLIEGAWDVSIETLQDLHDYTGFSALLSDLQNSALVKRGPLEFRVQNQQRVTVSMHASDPLALALDNREYPLRFASQYARNLPFLLVFVIHPWFSQGELHQNFSGFVDQFTNELSRLAFQSFRADSTVVEGITRADATKLLSGLVFLNGWPVSGTDAPRPHPFCRVFLNSFATHLLAPSDFVAFQAAFGNGIEIKAI